MYNIDQIIRERIERELEFNTRRHFIKDCVIGMGGLALGSFFISYDVFSNKKDNGKITLTDSDINPPASVAPPLQAEIKSKLKYTNPIKAYCIDFNWGEGGPNAFARPGLWSDANPEDHVNWYADLGCNVIQSFAVSCNGYAWYKNGIVPEQPGLKHDFLTEMVKIAHRKNMQVFGYFCTGANTKWGLENPELSYGYPSAPHIPYTTEYIDYLCTSIEDAIKMTKIDGVFIDWLWNPGTTMEPYPPLKWIKCEQVMFTELMNQNFPGKNRITPEVELEFRRKAINRCWRRIRETVKQTNLKCLIWLSCCQLNSRDIEDSDMLKQVDWLMNEAGDLTSLDAIRGQIGEHTRLITCLANWNGRDPVSTIKAANKAKIGMYGFTKPTDGSLLPKIDYFLETPVDSLNGDELNIAELARAYNYNIKRIE